MKVKYANKVYDVLYTMKFLGKSIYAVEDEPNHIDWLVNVEIVDEKEKSMKVYRVENEAEQKDVENYKQQLMLEMADLIADYILQKPTWSEEDELMLKDTIEFIETGWSDNGKSHLVYWLKSIKNKFK